MLETTNLCKSYFGRNVVKNVSLNLDKGHIFAILGPNGSGKTTFMKMVAGLVKPSEGMITFDGAPIGVESKKKVAYMSTEPFFYSYMNIRDVGKYYHDFFEDFSLEDYKFLLERMELDEKMKAGSLSSGMAAKLKIAATLARKAEFYMLDEPLNGIDIIARDRVMKTIVETANENNSIMVSSHLVDELETVADSVIFMKNGECIMQGDIESIRENHGESIAELYKELYTTNLERELGLR